MIPDLAILRIVSKALPYWCGQFLHEPGGHVRAIWENVPSNMLSSGLDRLICADKSGCAPFLLKSQMTIERMGGSE